MTFEDRVRSALNMPNFLAILRSMDFEIPEGASHVIINHYEEPTRISFVMSGGNAEAITRDLTDAEKAVVLEGLARHRQTRAVVKRVSK